MEKGAPTWLGNVFLTRGTFDIPRRRNGRLAQFHFNHHRPNMASSPSPRYQRAFVILAALSILQGHLVHTGPAMDHHQVIKRQATGTAGNGAFANDLGDFLASVISTGLRSAAAFLTSGSEASQRVAVAVGSAAIPPLLNVSRTYNRIQQSSRNIANATSPSRASLEPVNLGTLTRVSDITETVVAFPLFINTLFQQVNEGIRPSVQVFGDAFNQTFRSNTRPGPLGGLLLGGSRGSLLSNGSSSTSNDQQQPTRVNPFDTEIPDVIDWDN